MDIPNFSATAFATQFREYGDIVAQEIAREAADLRQSLTLQDHDLSLSINVDGPMVPAPNRMLEIIFQTYIPGHLGLIEYHSASRTYQREAIGGVNLDAKNLETQRMQQTLYNWQGKYQNVKTELATTYLRELVARESGVSAGGSDLNETLKELFQTFFPEKAYLGVQPDPSGGLNFPVKLSSGQTHDINELSSGEKEVLYGYLRLRNSTPLHSTILLDEPELHLNPGLLRGFPDFYHRHLGKARGNQLWLVTHSDTLLRQAVGNANYSVLHMTSAATEQSSDNQALPVMADDDLERATIDLVGDLATYRPQGKVLLFEGGGDTDVDVLIMQRLFPTFSKRVNLVSGGSKRRVLDLHEVLASTAEQVGLASRFFSVTDKDSAPSVEPTQGAHRLSWDVYHIENYLLEPRFVRLATAALLARDPFGSDAAAADALRDAAELLIPGLVIEQLRKAINSRLVLSMKLGADPSQSNAALALLPAIEATYGRLEAAKGQITDKAWLGSEAVHIEASLRDWLSTDAWTKEFPGRLILKRFVDTHLRGQANYEAFRNIILDQMVDDLYEPTGMRIVVDFISDADSSSSGDPDPGTVEMLKQSHC